MCICFGGDGGKASVGIISSSSLRTAMTGRKNRALQVPPVVPYKALRNFPKALFGTTRGPCSSQFFPPVMPSGKSEKLRRFESGWNVFWLLS